MVCATPKYAWYLNGYTTYLNILNVTQGKSTQLDLLKIYKLANCITF